MIYSIKHKNVLDTISQFKKLISDSQNILIVFSDDQDGDALASSLAFKNYLRQQNKRVDVVCPNFSLAQKFKFLSGIDDIKPGFQGLKKFIIRVNVAKAKIKNLSYDIKDDWLSVNLTPTGGVITKDDIRTAETDYKYDLIVLFNVSDLEALGDLFFNNTELFYQVPTINIDHRSHNEHYGKINMVEITATSSAEILFKALEQTDTNYIDAEVATSLLAGMIAETQSFKSNNVSPKTLKLAGRLLNLKADREKIVQHLYRTKTIAGLKLWGLVLSNLNHDPASGLVWTAISKSDFLRSGATTSDLKEVIKEISDNTPEARSVLVVYENPELNTSEIFALLYTEKNLDASRLAVKFHPLGGKAEASFSLKNISLMEATKAITTEINEKIKRILSSL